MKSSDFYCKRNILAWKHVVWAILRECPLSGLTPRAEREKSQKVSDSHRNDVSPLTQGLRYLAACDIPEIFAYNRGFRVWTIEWRQTNSTATNPRCHGNEIWDKIGYNSSYVRDIPEIFAYNRGFSWSGYWIMPDKFYHDQTLLSWQRTFWDKIGYNSACIRDISS